MRVRARFGKGAAKPRKAGEQSKHERAYEEHLLGRLGTDVAWFRYEAVNLKLADGAMYRPDFCVMLHDGTICMDEVKPGSRSKDGSVRTVIGDVSALKLKLADERFPFRFRLVSVIPVRGGKGGHEFVIEDVNPDEIAAAS
jgi:hypothetical protein